MLIIAVNSAGDKAIAGPVMAAAIVYRVNSREPVFKLRSQTKSLGDINRLPLEYTRKICDYLANTCIGYAITTKSVTAVNEQGYKAARLSAMSFAAVRALERARFRGVPKERVEIHVAGFFPLATDLVGATPQVLRKREVDWRLNAAFALAKCSRDNLMEDYAARWPEYGFDQHSGYMTDVHREALEQHGPTPQHYKHTPVLRLME